MKAPSEYADDAFEEEWLERMSPRERRLYQDRRASRRMYGSDLTQGEWREFGRLRALHGEPAAHEFADAIRAARRAEERVHVGLSLSERIGAAAFTAFGRTCVSLVFVAFATAFGGHLGYYLSASVSACVVCVATVAAFTSGKAA